MPPQQKGREENNPTPFRHSHPEESPVESTGSTSDLCPLLLSFTGSQPGIPSREPSLSYGKQRCKASQLCSTPGSLEKPQRAGFLFFEGILMPVLLTCSIQMFKPGSQRGCWHSWSDSGTEMDGSSQGNMARIITDMGWKAWKISAYFTLGDFFD